MGGMELRSGWVVGQGILASVHRPTFEQGVHLVLSRWTALQLALDQQWGGTNTAEKAQNVYDELLDWFYRRKQHFVDELEPLLDTIISEDFNVQAEDNSPHEVAHELINLYQQCLEGDFSIIEKLRAVQPAVRASTGVLATDLDGAAMEESSSDDDEDGDDGDEGSMDTDAPAAVPLKGPIVDDEGFQMVTRGRRR